MQGWACKRRDVGFSVLAVPEHSQGRLPPMSFSSSAGYQRIRCLIIQFCPPVTGPMQSHGGFDDPPWHGGRCQLSGRVPEGRLEPPLGGPGLRGLGVSVGISIWAGAKRDDRNVPPDGRSRAGASTATTGRPLAWASSTTWPKVSVTLANRKASAFA